MIDAIKDVIKWILMGCPKPVKIKVKAKEGRDE